VSGLDAVRMLRKTQMPIVAFVTAHDEYAIEAFEVNAVDYLLKPVEKSRLAETLARASEQLEHVDWRTLEHERLKNAAATYAQAVDHEPLERIPVRVRDDIHLVPVGDIASIVADCELLRITTNENKRHIINYRLKDLELRLDPKQFVRL